MIPETEVAFGQYLTQQAKLNGITTAIITAGKKFTVAPNVAQRIEKRIQESSSFLKAINIVPVINQQGQKIGLGVSGPAASNTDTTQQDRVPRDLSDMTAQNYFCQQTNFDTLLRYEKIDMWAAFPNFQPILRDSILQRQALDRIMIGWNGTHRAKTSDPVAFPLLQDVAPGWLQKCRDDAPERVMAGGKDPTKVVIGKDGDYENLDAAVMDGTNNLIAPWYQDDPKLVVICGRQLLADKYFPLVNQQQPNSEALSADIIISQKRIGGLQAVRVPYFPANALMVTRLDNLSIYWQKGTRRRCIVDNAKRDQVENYESVNQDYIVEDYEGCCVIENIEMTQTSLDGKGTEQEDRVNAAVAKAVEAMAAAFQRIPAAESARLTETSVDTVSPEAPVPTLAPDTDAEPKQGGPQNNSAASDTTADNPGQAEQDDGKQPGAETKPDAKKAGKS